MLPFNSPKISCSIPRKKNILISQKLQAWSPKKTNFYLPKIEVLLYLENDIFQSPKMTHSICRKRNISISRGRQFSISRKWKYCNILKTTYFNLREWHSSTPRKWSISVSLARQTSISRTLKYFNITKIRYLNLPKIVRLNSSREFPKKMFCSKQHVIQEVPSRQQISAKIGLIRYLMTSSNPVLVNFLVWCQTFPWSGKQHLSLLKKVVAHCVWNEC